MNYNEFLEALRGEGYYVELEIDPYNTLLRNKYDNSLALLHYNGRAWILIN